MKFKNKHFTLSSHNSLLCGLLMIVSTMSFALKDDTNQPINIHSDNQSLDLDKNVVIFTDNVEITQGSISIKADKVIITRPAEKSGQKEKVEAFGNPVTFHQLLDDGKPVNGQAQKVHYDLTDEFLVLTGNAELKQLDSRITANQITYDVKKQQLKANGNSQRVKTVLIPNQLNQKK